MNDFFQFLLDGYRQWQPSPLLVVGFMAFLGLYAGRSIKKIKLPSIIGFMVAGLLLGPSLLNLLSDGVQQNFAFITEVALSFVALSIGLELSFSSLKSQGPGIVLVILIESLLAFALTTTAVYLLTRDLPMALIFGAIAPASAPAGTVAIIQEFKARGSLTKALYAVVGFDDGLGVIIFGFAAALSRSLLEGEMGTASTGLGALLAPPLIEIGLSLAVGIGLALLFCLLARKIRGGRDLFILTFAVVMISAGICSALHLSIILTNMVIGLVAVNTQPQRLIHQISEELSQIMPLLFVLFFVLAGSNLHILALPSLGLLGLVYVLSRSAGLMGGAALGAAMGRMDSKIRKYLGMGILSQAGVAIGFSLIVKQEFSHLGSHGAQIGSAVITTITATCIFFEIIGPILTKIGLEKAGEITTKESA